MNDKKKAFADLIISGQHPVDAINVVYQGISPKTAKNKASLFGKCPEILAYIEYNSGHIRETVNEYNNEIVKEHITKSVEKKSGGILTAIRKQQILNEIAEGKATYEKIIVFNGKLKTIKCKPTPNERIKAIEVANRMTGDTVKAKEAAVHKAQEVQKMIIKDDQSETISKLEDNGSTG